MVKAVIYKYHNMKITKFKYLKKTLFILANIILAYLLYMIVVSEREERREKVHKAGQSVTIPFKKIKDNVK